MHAHVVIYTIQVPGGLDSGCPRDRFLSLREKQAGSGVEGVDDQASHGREAVVLLSTLPSLQLAKTCLFFARNGSLHVPRVA